MILSVMCERCFAAGNHFYALFRRSLKQDKNLFSASWCQGFNSVLIPDHLSSGMQMDTFAGVDSDLPGPELTHPYPKLAVKEIPLGATISNADLELCFHHITSELSPVVIALFSPMGIQEASSKDPITSNSLVTRLCPYLVPAVNHRDQNLQLLQNLMHQTILKKNTCMNLESSSTVLSFRMVVGEGDSIATFDTYNKLEPGLLKGHPKAQLLQNSSCDEELNNLFIFLSIVGVEENVQEQGFGKKLATGMEDIKARLQKVESNKNNGTPEYKQREDNTAAVVRMMKYNMCKRLVAYRLQKLYQGSQDSQGPSAKNCHEAFCLELDSLKSKIPALAPFFPYVRKQGLVTSHYPFHHFRFLLGSITLLRDAAIEGCHRNSCQILALMNCRLPGSPKPGHGLTIPCRTEEEVNTSLFFKSAIVYDAIPALPICTPSETNLKMVSQKYPSQLYFTPNCLY
jgi:hypothetical protein